MAVPETARHDLYNGLVDLLGADRAGTLMTYLAGFDPSHLATKTDVAELRSDLVSRIGRFEGVLVEFKTEMREFKTEMREFKTEMREFKTETREVKTETRGALDAINTRLDRLFLCLLVGLFVVVAAMAGVFFTVG